MRLLGHLPDTQEHREADCHPETGCLYRASGDPVGTVLRPRSRIHSQPVLPDCTGESIAACVEAATGKPVSGRDIWQEGLRRTGTAPGLDTGLAFVPALVGLQARGWAPYHEGEELELPPVKPTLLDELAAADRPGRVVERWRIPTGGEATAKAPELAADALFRGCDVVVGMLVTDSYQAYRPRPGALSICGIDMLGPRGEPHAQRVLGFIRIAGETYGVLQNSWGVDWGGALVNGNWIAGCALVSMEALAHVYDWHVVRVQ